MDVGSDQDRIVHSSLDFVVVVVGFVDVVVAVEQPKHLNIYIINNYIYIFFFLDTFFFFFFETNNSTNNTHSTETKKKYI